MKKQVFGVALLGIILAVIYFVMHGCGGKTPPPDGQPAPQQTPPPDKTPDPAPAPAPAPTPPAVTCPDGSKPGTERVVACPQGSQGVHKQLCTADGKWNDEFDTCSATPPPACDKKVFTDVEPILDQNCKGCHATITTYATASAWATEIARRIALPQNDNDHMPQKQAKQLCTPPNAANDPSQPTSCDEEKDLVEWVNDGALMNCPGGQNPPPPGPTPPPTGSTITLDQIDAAMVNDASSLNASDRPFTRYLVAADVINDQDFAGPSQLQICVDAMNKGLNSLNAVGSDLVPVKAIAKGLGVYRIDLRNYAISAAKIAAAETADVNINIVDNTSKGQVLQTLLGTKKPWWHANNFLDVAFRNSSIYYTMVNIPGTLAALQQQIGVNFATDLATLPNNSVTGLPQVSFIGDIGQITEQKPRLIFHDTQVTSPSGKAYYWQTFDVNANANNVQINGKNVNTKNLFEAPLLTGTGGQVGNGIHASQFNLTQDASETIHQLPNGLQGYALWDSQGNRLNAADPNVVIDTQTPLGNKVITAGNTCSRCHNGGLIPMGDTLLAHVTANADQFTQNDVQLVKAVYHGADANAKLFAADQDTFNDALKALGIQPGADPQAQVSDRFLNNWDASQAAGFLFLSLGDFKSCINSSPNSKATMGAFLSGGTVPFATFSAGLAQLITDCHLFQDAIN